jgi:hypothetical protein
MPPTGRIDPAQFILTSRAEKSTDKICGLESTTHKHQCPPGTIFALWTIGVNKKAKESRSREQGAGTRDQGVGGREPGAGSREQGAGTREQGPGVGGREPGPGPGTREPGPGRGPGGVMQCRGTRHRTKKGLQELSPAQIISCKSNNLQNCYIVYHVEEDNR